MVTSLLDGENKNYLRVIETS